MMASDVIIKYSFIHTVDNFHNQRECLVQPDYPPLPYVLSICFILVNSILHLVNFPVLMGLLTTSECHLLEPLDNMNK
jgi:hypothetical protein